MAQIPASAVSTSGNTTTITIPSDGYINKATTMSGACPTGTHLVIDNPNNYTYSMSSETFRNCASLETVTINGNVYNIGGAFSYSNSLQEVTINGNVTVMTAAFRECVSLSSITFTQTKPPSMGTGPDIAFRDVPGPVVVNLTYKAKESVWRNALIAAGLENFTIQLAEEHPRKKTNIGRINIKQGKVEIKPRE